MKRTRDARKTKHLNKRRLHVLPSYQTGNSFFECLRKNCSKNSLPFKQTLAYRRYIRVRVINEINDSRFAREMRNNSNRCKVYKELYIKRRTNYSRQQEKWQWQKDWHSNGKLTKIRWYTVIDEIRTVTSSDEYEQIGVVAANDK